MAFQKLIQRSTQQIGNSQPEPVTGFLQDLTAALRQIEGQGIRVLPARCDDLRRRGLTLGLAFCAAIDLRGACDRKFFAAGRTGFHVTDMILFAAFHALFLYYIAAVLAVPRMMCNGGEFRSAALTVKCFFVSIHRGQLLS